MTSVTPRLRRWIGVWPLRRQIMLVFLLLTLGVVLVGGLAGQQIVSGYLTARFEENTANTLDFLGGAVLEPLLARDVPQLESIVKQSLLRDRQILSMTIEDRQGAVMVHLSAGNVQPVHPPLSSTGEVRLDGRVIGKMTIRLSTDQARADIYRDGLKFAGLLLGLLLVLSFVLVGAVHYLVIAPVRRIHDYLITVAQGKSAGKLAGQPSLELNQLAQSANLLYDHVEADRLRRHELQREVEALASRVARLGQYTLLQKLGEGGMGEVWKAQHALLRRPTAIKLLNQRSVGPDSLIRFEREVQLTSSLTHANTIAIFDFGRTDQGVFYYVMEYLEGWNLEQLVVSHGPQPPGRVIHILRQVCGSLREAHENGLIHRDIKPANIFLCRRGGLHDVVKVLDFGLVAEVRPQGDREQSLAAHLAGTPAYMPPEVIRGAAAPAPTADLYSLGGVGYFLLTGHRLFDHCSLDQLLQAQLNEPVTPPSVRLGLPVSPDLEELLMSALAKQPQQRPQSAAAFLNLLERCEQATDWPEESARAWWESHGNYTGAAAISQATATMGIIKQETDERGIQLTADFGQRVDGGLSIIVNGQGQTDTKP